MSPDPFHLDDAKACATIASAVERLLIACRAARLARSQAQLTEAEAVAHAMALLDHRFLQAYLAEARRIDADLRRQGYHQLADDITDAIAVLDPDLTTAQRVAVIHEVQSRQTPPQAV